MKKQVVILFLCLLASLLVGCAKKDTGSNMMVRQIRVAVQTGDQMLHRDYYSSGALRRILGAIRLLGQESNPYLDPEQLDAPITSITLYQTDDGQSTIALKGDRFIRRGNLPWRQTDPEKMSRLYALIEQLPAELE